MRDAGTTKRVAVKKPRKAAKPNLTPGIVKTPGVCGGDARFIRTRIPVWGIEALWRLGDTDEKILSSYPSLERSDLSQARIYAARHRKEMDFLIRDNEELS